MAVVIQFVGQNSLAPPHDRATAADNSRRWGAPIRLAGQPGRSGRRPSAPAPAPLLVALLFALKPE